MWLLKATSEGPAGRVVIVIVIVIELLLLMIFLKNFNEICDG
jgi:hypothetical protein